MDPRFLKKPKSEQDDDDRRLFDGAPRVIPCDTERSTAAATTTLRNGVGVGDSNVGVEKDAVYDGDDDDQEEVLAALVAHRAKECDHIRQRIAHYKAQLEETEGKLKESQAKLDRLRSRSNVWAPAPGPGPAFPSPAVKVETSPYGRPVNNTNDDLVRPRPAAPQHTSRPQLIIPPHSAMPPAKAMNVKVAPIVKSGSVLGSGQPSAGSNASRVGTASYPQSDSNSKPPPEQNMSDKKTILGKGRPDRSAETGIKRKREQEHQDLIPLVQSSSSPSLIRFQSSTHISSQHKRKLRSIELCPVNDNLFVTSALDGVVNLWQVQGKGASATLLSSSDCASPKQRRWPEDITWHPDGDCLLASYTADGGDFQISVLNLNATQEKRVTFLEQKPHRKGIINSIHFMPWIEICFATGGSDHMVVLWQDTDTSWKPKTMHMHLHSSAVMGVAGLHQKKAILSAGADRRIISYDLLAGRSDFKHQLDSKCMSVLPNPSDFNLFMVQTGTPNKQLRLFDIRLRQTEIHAFGWKQETSESQSALINQAWSPDGFHVSSGSADPMIHIFDIRYDGHRPSQSVQAHQKRVFKAIWHHSLPLLTSISSDLNIGLHRMK